MRQFTLLALPHISEREKEGKKWPKKHWPQNNNWSKEIKEPRRRRGEKKHFNIYFMHNTRRTDA